MTTKRRETLRALLGVALIVGGLLATLPTPYREHAYFFDAAGCRLETTVIEPKLATPRGTVVVLHGLAANKKIMSYLAKGFAAQDLRVFVPDLPGQGHSRQGFSPRREQECADALLEELYARHLAEPAATVVAGHSMGGTLALNAAEHVGAAGVIVLSPAPMRAAHGARPQDVLFGGPPEDVRNALVVSGGWELESMRGNAADLVANGSFQSRYVVIPDATHGSLLFDPRVVREAQGWAAHLLGLPKTEALPSHRGLIAFVCGFVGLLLISASFLRELCGAVRPVEHVPARVARRVLVAIKICGAAAFAVLVLRWWNPARAIRLFDGDYLAGFALLAGVPLLIAHWRRFVRDGRSVTSERDGAQQGLPEQAGYAPSIQSWKSATKRTPPQGLKPVEIAGRNVGAKAPTPKKPYSKFRTLDTRAANKLRTVLVAAFGAMAIFVLASGWFELTLSEAWLNASRWWRFPFLAVAFLPYHWAEELLLGGTESLSGWWRLAAGVGLRGSAWGGLLGGILLLHSGEVLLGLLVPYFALLTIFQRRGMDLVRNGTGSAAVAAVFGAILFAGFCLVIFPLR